MSQVSKFRRAAAIVLSGALLATAIPSVQAMPMPMSRDFAADPVAEQVQYRRAPVRQQVRRGARRGNQAAGAAAIIGALAIGAAAIAASQNRRERTYYNEYDGGYAPAPGAYHNPRYGQQQHYYQAPVAQPEYYPEGYGYRPRAHRPAQIDPGSNYAVEQQRAQNRVRHHQIVPQYYPGY